MVQKVPCILIACCVLNLRALYVAYFSVYYSYEFEIEC